MPTSTCCKHPMICADSFEPAPKCSTATNFLIPDQKHQMPPLSRHTYHISKKMPFQAPWQKSIGLAFLLTLALLQFPGCSYPTAPLSDFSEAPDDIVVKIIKETIGLDGRINNQQALNSLNERLPKSPTDLQPFLKENHISCAPGDVEITCQHEVVWKIIRQDPYTKCDNPLNSKECRATTFTRIKINVTPPASATFIEFTNK
jgi:hypothetical protein